MQPTWPRYVTSKSTPQTKTVDVSCLVPSGAPGASGHGKRPCTIQGPESFAVPSLGMIPVLSFWLTQRRIQYDDSHVGSTASTEKED